MSPSSFRVPRLCLLLLFVSTPAQPRAAPRRSDPQVPEELLGAPIGSLLLGRPEVGEGSADSPAVQSRGRLQHRPRLFLDFLGPQRKFGSRTRSSRRGCFGLKMDRIGAVSGLGC
ncbi:C-type natriuretic peptide 2-like [Scleropages formosus]|uniref:C-type natriuretic peptide 2-like n=1 Tax=Scleropages formosus TaxID=113540 RepID=UPI0010FAA692|nr:C-type natriuretic peptide 2-like [Scleropages formosus]